MPRDKDSRKKRQRQPKGLTLDVSELSRGVPRLSPGHCTFLAEAASVVLDDANHPADVTLVVDGDFDCTCAIRWLPVTQEMRNSFQDIDEAVEYGAMALAVLHVQEFSPFRVIERSYKGTGFDYWLGKKRDPLFQRKGRLEASGIRCGTSQHIETRVQTKCAQIQQSAGLGLPGYVVVVEFSTPRSRMVKR